jgi:phosphoglycolate phosphatase
MIRAVLFDLDGTLADTAPDLGYALNLQLQRYGRELLAIELIRPHASAGARGLLKLGFGIEPEDEEFGVMRSEYLDLYDQNLCRETVLFPGIDELLEALKTRAIPWGIVTNKPERFTLPLVKQLGLFHGAACVVCGDSVPRAKPHPDSLLRASEVLDITPGDIIYVGDDERDVQAARAARMTSIIAGYGYLGNGNHPETWGAQAIIKQPSEVLNFL